MSVDITRAPSSVWGNNNKSNNKFNILTVSTLADSYLHLSAQTTEGAADLAAPGRKPGTQTFGSYTFQPLAFETLGPLNASSMAFVTELGRHLSESIDDPRESAFLFQRQSLSQSLFKGLTLSCYKKHLTFPTASRTSSYSSFFACF